MNNIPETIKRINKKNSNGKEASRYYGRLRSGCKSLQDLVVATDVANRDFSLVFHKKVKDKHLLRVIGKSIKKLKILRDVLIDDALNEQYLYLKIGEGDIHRYRYMCRFKICLDNIHTIKGFDKLVTYGLYEKNTNPNGVVKDHRISIKYGFDNNLSHDIIGNIANCEFLRYNENAIKSDKNAITINELLFEMKK